MPGLNTMTPTGWVGFEVSVLRRLNFKSVAIPFTGEPALAIYLKRLGTRVAANDLAQWSNAKCRAQLEGDKERLSADDIEAVLDGAYVPRDSYYNPALLSWFNEIDAFWFDNVRVNIERLSSQALRAHALTLGMMVGDYVLSFDEETRCLRHPLALSNIFKRLWETQLPLIRGSQRCGSFNREARDFAAEQHTDLLFVRLPNPKNRNAGRSSLSSWREEWVRGTNDFWTELEQKRSGRLGDFVETRQQYLRLVEEFLQGCSHIESWAISHVEDGFVSTPEMVECVGRVRRVDAVYTKDFSELTGARAAIITA